MRRSSIKQKKKVLVIGAGWSGIYATKHLLEAGFEPEVFEKSHNFMGQWHIHNGPGGVIRHTHATSSIGYLHPSDFPFPEGTPDFPHHSLIYDHIARYIDHFKIGPYIHYEHTVTKIEKTKNGWMATINNNFSKEYDFVVVTTGVNKIPSFPNSKLFSKFKGETIHSHFFKILPEHWKGKKILIVGGGETAADIADEICDDAEVTLSIQGGVWFQDKILGAYEPADMLYNRMTHFFFRWWANGLFARVVQFWWGEGGSGISFWRPHSSYLNGIYNKSRNVVHCISEGRVLPKPGVVDVQEDGVRFHKENKFTPIDIIIFATGYDILHTFDFLPKSLRRLERYKHIFVPGDSTIAFVGFIRPFLGSIPMLAELQSRYVTEVFSGSISLPSPTKMELVIERDKKEHIKHFPEDGRRVSFLVDPFSYSTEIGHFFGASPKMILLFFTNFLLWRKLFIQPWAPYQWRIYDKDERKRRVALAQIDKLENHPVSKRIRQVLAVNIILLLLLVLVGILGATIIYK